MSKEIIKRITEYLSGGGLFNPEMANHDHVRDLLIDCRNALEAELSKPVNEFNPGWDQIKPYHDRIAELETQLTKPEQTQTDLRKAAEMALYGLLDARQVMAITYNDKHAYQDEIEALRQALAQSANQSDCGHKEYKPFCQMCMATKQEPVRSFQQFGDTQPEQEPVAIIDDDGFAWGYGIEGGKLPSGTKVYTAPPKPDVTLTNKGKTEQDSFNRLIRIMGTFDLATGHADGWDDLLDSLEAELRDVLGHYREALKQAQPEQEPVAHAVIAGVLFDFMGWLTSRKDRLVLSASDEASPAVNAIQEFANMRGLSLDDAKVEDWQDMTTAPPKREWQGLTSEELFDIMIKHAGSPVGQVFAIEAKLREKNG